jgi:hypothetical protein
MPVTNENRMPNAALAGRCLDGQPGRTID